MRSPTSNFRVKESLRGKFRATVVEAETNLWLPGSDASQKESFFMSWGHRLQDQWVSCMMLIVTHCLLAQDTEGAEARTVAQGSDSYPYSDLFLGLLTAGAEGDVWRDFPNVWGLQGISRAGLLLTQGAGCSAYHTPPLAQKVLH